MVVALLRRLLAQGLQHREGASETCAELRAQNCAELRACSPNEMKSSPLTHFINDEITVDAMSRPMKVAPRQSVDPIRLVGTISP